MKRSPLKRGAGLKRVSKKRAKENRVRAGVLARLRAEHPMCQRCGVARSVDGHELLPRSAGGSITDRDNIVMLCRRCHEWVDAEPRQAIAEGWKVSRYQ